MNGRDTWLEYCLDQALGPNKLSNKALRALKSFYMRQQALSAELLEAKPLGICKIDGLTSQDPTIQASSNIESSKEMSS